MARDVLAVTRAIRVCVCVLTAMFGAHTCSSSSQWVYIGGDHTRFSYRHLRHSLAVSYCRSVCAARDCRVRASRSKKSGIVSTAAY